MYSGAYLEGENQMTELEDGLQVQPDADLMNSWTPNRADGKLTL